MRVTWLGGSPPLVEPTFCFSFKDFAKFFNAFKILQKMHFEASRAIFWSLLCYKGSLKTYHKAIFTGRTQPSDPHTKF